MIRGSDADVASLRAALAAALEANACWERTAAGLREALAGRDAEIARQSAELERVSAALAVLQRMVFGDSSERSRPEPPAPLRAGLRLPGAGDGDGAGAAEGDREGPVLQRVHRDAPHRAVRCRAEHELAGDGAGPAGRGDLPGYFGGGVRGGRARGRGRCSSRWRTRLRSGRGARGTCTRMRRRGGYSRPVTAAARRSGGSGFSSAPIPCAS